LEFGGLVSTGDVEGPGGCGVGGFGTTSPSLEHDSNTREQKVINIRFFILSVWM
jgi:hypothetical protein